MSVKKIFTFGAYKYCHIGPTYWYCSFLLFTWQSFESLWRAIFNPVIWPVQPWGGQYHSRNQQHLGFVPCPQKHMHIPQSVAGKQMVTGWSPNLGHILSERSCIPSLGKLVMLFYKILKISPVRWMRWLQNSKQI